MMGDLVQSMRNKNLFKPLTLSQARLKKSLKLENMLKNIVMRFIA
jgi:hypothetical protein